MFVLPGAHEAIDWLRPLDVNLALVTNGAADMQRAKVERFELTHRIDRIQIEGEHGFGKPEERAYLHAINSLGVTAGNTWMIGDNLEWEVVTPQRLIVESRSPIESASCVAPLAAPLPPLVLRFCNGPRSVNPFLRCPLAGVSLLYGVGARPAPM